MLDITKIIRTELFLIWDKKRLVVLPKTGTFQRKNTIEIPNHQEYRVFWHILSETWAHFNKKKSLMKWYIPGKKVYKI